MGAAEILKIVWEAGLTYEEFIPKGHPDWLAEEEAARAAAAKAAKTGVDKA